LVLQDRSSSTRLQNLPEHIKVFYNEDLQFLDGAIDVLLPEGLDESAQVDLFFLCKVASKEDIEPRIELRGAPGITWAKTGNIARENVPAVQKPATVDQKLSLTPEIVTFYAGKQTIFLVWAKPQNADYRGVRIFRSSERVTPSLSDFGKELYDGPGDIRPVKCDSDKQPIESEESNKSLQEKARRDQAAMYIEPTPKKDRGLKPPGSFRNMRIMWEEEEMGNGLHFADTTAKSGTTYTYTLFAYDDKERYSYPVVVHASLADWSKTNTCYIVKPAKK
jgi:hypothetical protein